MAGSKTYNCWLEGKFVLEDTFLLQSEGIESKKRPLVVKTKELHLEELKKIQKEQKRIGRAIIKKNLKVARDYFTKVRKVTHTSYKLVKSELKVIGQVLEGGFPNDLLIYESTCFGFMLNRDQCRTVASFYKTDIETGNPRYFSFIASPKHFEASNLCAPQIIAYFLCELREWLSEMSKDKLKRLSDFSEQKNFVIAINFANGKIPKWDSEGMTSGEIARHFKVPNYHNLISDSLSTSDKSKKSIYRNHTLMRTTIEYCEFYGLRVTRDFRKRFKERKSNLSARH
jgi:hypothetical protein